jgi:hypothetical protein
MSEPLGGSYGASRPGDESLGEYGTVRIRSTPINDVTDPATGRTVKAEDIKQRTYVHELGNLLSRKLTGSGRAFGTIGGIKGVMTSPDPDTGARLEKCVFGDVFP